MAPSRSRFNNPCPGYGLTVSTGVFGAPRTGHLHAGWDYTAPTGTPCRASAPGTVTKAGQGSASAGLAVYIDHGAGWSTFGCHLSKVLVEAGQKVRAGDVYGLVGESGNAVGPHLHAEWRLFGVAQDPAYIVEGDAGANVLRVQRRLRIHGYAPGELDGVFGPRTAAALAAFQADRKLDTTGVPDAWTVGALARGKAKDDG